MVPFGRVTKPVNFLLGCGRSGTTILGQALGRHPGIYYLNEPIHYWYAIDSRTDHLNFFGGHGRCFFEEKDLTPRMRRRFQRLFGQLQWYADHKIIVEKLPVNPLRMAWLNALCPSARFIHLIRDGRYVCRSIEELSHSTRYQVAGKAGLNQWWGRQFHKWNVFARECKEREIYADSFAALPEPTPDLYPAMAALEWLVRLRSARAAVAALALGSDRYLEVRYENLVADPQTTLAQIEAALAIAARCGDRGCRQACVGGAALAHARCAATCTTLL